MNIALNYADDTDEQNPQIFIYSAGVGTANRSSRVVAGAFGEGLDALILNAYINLASNYVPGDKIYIFGFSRGAVAARALTGFISFCGLLKANSLSLTNNAWRYFTRQENEIDIAALSEQTVNPEIEFLGVWDTVPGPYRLVDLRRRYRFENLLLNRNVKCGVHILSIDETRKAFSPLLWEGCDNHQILEQIWIPGVHGDVGGGYSEAFLSTVSLLLMIDRLAQQCPNLSFDTDYITKVLLPIVDKQDVVINNEWERYLGRYLKLLTRKFRTVVDTPGHGHAQHPLAELILNREITIRSRERVKYAPALRLLGKSKRLPEAKFTAQSDKLLKILERRFPKPPAPVAPE